MQFPILDHFFNSLIFIVIPSPKKASTYKYNIGSVASKNSTKIKYSKETRNENTQQQ